MTVATYQVLVEALQGSGGAVVVVTREISQRAARGRLIEAARRAGVRISMKRTIDDHGDSCVIATVLADGDAELQRVRDVIFRGVNRIRTGLEILTSGSIDTGPIDDQVFDLREIANELEEFARTLGQKMGGGR